LARHALDETRRRGDVAVVYCSYVAAFVEKHAEYEDIVAWPEHEQ
jgi:predicted GNAT family acetyltransferase